MHLDHTSEPGGAEIALGRLVDANLWIATIAIPKGPLQPNSPFANVPSSAHIERIGHKQEPGASTARSLLEAGKFSLGILNQARAIRRSRAFKEASVVHANSSRSALYGALACVGTGKTFVVHIRDQVDRGSMGAIGFFAFSRIALARADAVIANSNWTLSSAVRWIPKRAQTRVLPSPLGEAPSSPDESKDRDKIVGMLARIDSWKGHEVLIRAFADALGGSEWKLQIAGAPAFAKDYVLDDLHALTCELGIQNQVEFLGHVEDIWSLLSGWSIAVQSSTRPEPLGQNVLQYLAAGVPVIVTSEGGPTEWVNDEINGLTTHPRDMDALSSALIRLTSDEMLRVRLGRAAKKTPFLPFNGVSAQQHLDYFRDILASRRGQVR